MVDFSQFFPITVVVAIVIFVVKEVMEVGRRVHADRIKLGAIKTIISEEILFNNNIFISIYSLFDSATQNDERFEDTSISSYHDPVIDCAMSVVSYRNKKTQTKVHLIEQLPNIILR